MSSDKYIHSDVENRIYSYWEKNGLFKPKENSKKFSIVIPPPNVTGSLHMGHALNNSIQDLLVRYHRMNNFETLWQPGTDHAGIATQALVEKKLTSEKINKNRYAINQLIKPNGMGNYFVRLDATDNCDFSLEQIQINNKLYDNIPLIEEFPQRFELPGIYKQNIIVQEEFN